VRSRAVPRIAEGDFEEIAHGDAGDQPSESPKSPNGTGWLGGWGGKSPSVHDKIKAD